jgi:hypothetical protein
MVSMHIHGLSERFPAGSIRFGWRSCWSALSPTLCRPRPRTPRGLRSATCVLTLTQFSPGRREVGEALGAWWGGLVRSGRRTPGPSCFRRSDLARHATVGRFIRREFCEEACEKGPSVRWTLPCLRRCRSSPWLAFGLVSGAKGLNPRRQVKLPALLLRWSHARRYAHARRGCAPALLATLRAPLRGSCLLLVGP